MIRVCSGTTLEVPSLVYVRPQFEELGNGGPYLSISLYLTRPTTIDPFERPDIDLRVTFSSHDSSANQTIATSRVGLDSISSYWGSAFADWSTI